MIASPSSELYLMKTNPFGGVGTPLTSMPNSLPLGSPRSLTHAFRAARPISTLHAHMPIMTRRDWATSERQDARRGGCQLSALPPLSYPFSNRPSHRSASLVDGSADLSTPARRNPTGLRLRGRRSLLCP